MLGQDPYEQECYKNLRSCMKNCKSNSNTFVVDIGASYNSWFLQFPFNGILIEADIRKILSSPLGLGTYKKVCKYITPQNVNNILKENNVPKEFYMLNIDIDGYDLFVLLSLLKHYTPKIIITEINEKIPYPVKFSIKYVPNFDWGWCHLYGYSIACLEDLMKLYNYSIHSLCMNNIILYKNEGNDKPNIDEIEQIYKEGYLYNKNVPPPNWNDDVKHLQECKTKEEVAEAWHTYFLENKNPNNGSDQTANLDNYVINDSYEKYLKQFLKSLNT